MMFVALLLHLLAIPAMAMYLLLAVPAEGWHHVWKRLPLFIALWLAFALVTLLHVAGHTLDEILFRGYRRVQVKKPVFILGIPRSGTTYLQRLLANDTRFTTLTTWEAILAPSITERYVYRVLGGLLGPLENAIITVRGKLFRHMDTIHRIRLQEPEEDFLLFTPLLACLLLAFVCPGATHFWRLGQFDRRLPRWYRRAVMTFYTRCLQKHLHYHGHDLVLLSKNPSFTSMTGSLLETFADARVIACTRAPAEVIPSQLSSLRPVMALLGGGMLLPDTQNKMIGLLYHYYAQLVAFRHHPRVFLQPMTSLQNSLTASISQLYAFLEYPPSADLAATVARETGGRRYTSGHRYSLVEFALTEDLIDSAFADVWPIEDAPDKHASNNRSGWRA